MRSVELRRREEVEAPRATCCIVASPCPTTGLHRARRIRRRRWFRPTTSNSASRSFRPHPRSPSRSWDGGRISINGFATRSHQIHKNSEQVRSPRLDHSWAPRYRRCGGSQPTIPTDLHMVGMSSKRLPFQQNDRVSKGVRTKDFRSCRRPRGVACCRDSAVTLEMLTKGEDP